MPPTPSGKMVVALPIKHDGVRLAPGDECPSELAKALPEGYAMKESEYKKLLAETVEDDGDDEDEDDGE